MKYINTLALAVIVAVGASCAQSTPEFAGKNTIQSGQKLTLTASWGDPETRTERASDGAVLWSPGDQISLFYGSGDNGGSCFTGQNTEPSKVVNFTGEIGVITGGNDVAVEDTYFWAVYPYNPTASCNGSSITTVLPAIQVAKADTFADDLFPSVGRSQGLVMGFYNICGGLKFTISEEGIKSVTLQGHNNEIIAGAMTVGFDDAGQPVVLGVADGSDTITVSAPQGETFEVGKAYYIVLVPTVFENGFTLTFSKGYARATYDRTKKTTIRRSAFGGLTTPDAGLEWEMLYVPIPDANFKTYMIQNFDTNGNGELDFDEAEAVTEINVNTDIISSMMGIEYCANLQQLTCCGSNHTWNSTEHRYVGTGLIDALDVRSNPALTQLYCYNNQLSSLDIRENMLLSVLNCSYNQLASLDVSSNLMLTGLSCYYNQLTSLDIGHNTALLSLDCHSNQLTSLDLHSNTLLTYLDCGSNQLTSLDVSANTALTQFYCSYNSLTSLDLYANTALTQLYCNRNQLTSIDVSSNTALTGFNCSGNQLTSLDVRANTALTYYNCDSNQLTSLDISANTALTQLHCSSNQLTSLDLSTNTNLWYLGCDDNQLTSLNVSINTALNGLSCHSNHITSLDVSANNALNLLDCSPMNDAQGNNLLSYLYIAQGQSIPNVTVDRSTNYIPAETIIMVAPEPGGNEGTVDDNLDD